MAHCRLLGLPDFEDLPVPDFRTGKAWRVCVRTGTGCRLNQMTPDQQLAEDLIVKKNDLFNRMKTDPERRGEYEAELRQVEAELEKLRPKIA